MANYNSTAYSVLDSGSTNEERGETSFGVKAEGFYEDHRTLRNAVVDIGRRLADMTIPSVFPPENFNNGMGRLAVTNQSINALCINTLAGSLTLGALPPELPICKIEAIESKLQQDIQQDPELYAQVTYALSRREEIHRTRLASTSARGVYTQCMRHLLITGNVLVKWTDINTPTFHSMHNWVVHRDGQGFPVATVLKECISLAVADDDVVEAIKHVRASKSVLERYASGAKWDDEADIYHCQKWDKDEGREGMWLFWQETEGGYVIPGTDYYSPKDVPPMWPSCLLWEPGSDYGMGYCNDFEGDLSTCEELTSALRDGAAVVAWFLTFVNPTGQTNIRDVRTADNLSVLPGRAEDVTAFQSGKAGELNWVSTQLEGVARRLGQAFAMEASIQRTGERVTREEWVQMTKALDKAMGGLYTYISGSIQRWYIKRFIYLHEKEDKTLKPLPKDLVSVDIITGIDSIGRSSEYDTLMQLGKDLQSLFPKEFEARANVGDWTSRLAAGVATKVDGLMKPDEQIAKEQQAAQQQAMQASMVDKAAGPIAGKGMDMLHGILQKGQQDSQQQQAATQGGG
jgi:hypothetical protein